MNKVHRTAIDYNATQELVDEQITAINTILIGRTILDWKLDEEFLIAVYTDDDPIVGEQIQMGCLLNVTKEQFQTAIENQDFGEFVYIGRAVIWTYKI